MKHPSRTTVGVIAGLIVAAIGFTPATAETTNPDIEYALDAVPGGIVVDSDTVVWPELGMTLDVIPGWSRAVGTCPTGAHCAFSKAGLAGNRLTWTSCLPSHTVSGISSVGSIANARTGVTSRARSSSGGVLALAPSGGWADVSGTTSYVSCATGGIG